MVGYSNTSDAAKKAAEIGQKKEQYWPMVSFIHNGSDITTWIGNSASKPKAQCRATFLRQFHF